MPKSLTATARWGVAGLLAALVAWGCIVVEPTKPPPTATPAPPPAAPTPILPVSDPDLAALAPADTLPPSGAAADGVAAAAGPQSGDNPENRPDCCPIFQAGGLLTAAAWLDADRMYLADWDGRIRLLNVQTGEIRTALEGLSIPQGLTVLDGRLYLSEMGNVCGQLPTAAERAGCQPLVQWPAGERLEQLAQSSARILSYRIDAAGLLDDPQVVVDGILGNGWEHGPKSLVNDDEWIYVSIAHPYQGTPGTQADFLKVGADQLAADGGRPDLMGVIARFRPGDQELQVYATGFRNTAGLTLAPDGQLYGADNAAAGLLAAGQRQELNAVIQGGFYGYPAWGTNEAPPAELVREPVALLHGTAATFVYANEQGLYAAYLAAEEDGAGFVIDRFDYATFTPTRIFSGAAGYITAILERQGLLYLVTFYGQIQVINPEQSAAANSSRRPNEFAGELEKIVREREPDISFNYAVYAAEGRLIYLQDPCPPGEVNRRFFLHIDPVSQDDLPEYRREYGFDNLDFRFGDYGTRSGNRCLAAVPLPRYPIANIWTGYNEAWHWEGHIDLK